MSGNVFGWISPVDKSFAIKDNREPGCVCVEIGIYGFSGFLMRDHCSQEGRPGFRCGLVALACIVLLLASCEARHHSRNPLSVPGNNPVEVSPGPRRHTPHVVFGARNLEERQILGAFGGVYHLPVLEAGLQQIVDRLALLSDRPGIHYDVTILNSSSIHAFLLPKERRLYLTRGLLALANDADEVAAVLAHEVGHVTAGHQLPNAETQGVTFSRLQELEADRIGLEITRRAGFDPSAALTFLHSLIREKEHRRERFGRSGAREDEYFSITHPSFPERIEWIQKLIHSPNTVSGNSPERDRAGYLRLIDGMIYADAPRDGYVRGRIFVHPHLRVMFEVPEGFVLHNVEDAVFVVGPQDAVIRFDGVKIGEYRGGLSEYIHEAWGEERGLTVLPFPKELRGGMPIFYGSAEYGGWNYRLAMIPLKDDLALRFLLAQHEISPASEAAFDNTVASFRALDRDEVALLRPLRIRVIQTMPGDTVASLSMCCMHWTQSPREEFRVLNGLSPQDTIEPYRLVKIIVEE